MYGLPQAGWVSYDKLVKYLASFGYHPIKYMPLLWKYKTHPITFCLVVYEFGVKYVGRKHVEHLANTIKPNYNITCDW